MLRIIPDFARISLRRFRASQENQGMNHLARITLDPAVMGGKPCIRGLRVTVATIVGLMATGHPQDEILRAYPYLEAGDFEEALAYTLRG